MEDNTPTGRTHLHVEVAADDWHRCRVLLSLVRVELEQSSFSALARAALDEALLLATVNAGISVEAGDEWD